MATLSAWLAVAGLGALHGLSPATGWMFAAACGIRARDATQARLALVPIALGHAASVAVMACAMAMGLSMDRALCQGLAGALLVGAAAYRLRPGAGWHEPMGASCGTGLPGVDRTSPGPYREPRPGDPAIPTRARHAGLALWSFVMASAHGAGLMLVPALAPLCLGDSPAREITASGSLVVALAAVGVHTAAMLVTTGVVAAGLCRGFAMHPRLREGTALRRAWTGALAVTGLLLLSLR